MVSGEVAEGKGVVDVGGHDIGAEGEFAACADGNGDVGGEGEGEDGEESGGDGEVHCFRGDVDVVGLACGVW